MSEKYGYYFIWDNDTEKYFTLHGDHLNTESRIIPIFANIEELEIFMGEFGIWDDESKEIFDPYEIRKINFTDTGVINVENITK